MLKSNFHSLNEARRYIKTENSFEEMYIYKVIIIYNIENNSEGVAVLPREQPLNNTISDLIRGIRMYLKLFPVYQLDICLTVMVDGFH